MDINVRSTILIVAAAAKHLARPSRIVLLSSVSARGGFVSQTVYGTIFRVFRADSSLAENSMQERPRHALRTLRESGPRSWDRSTERRSTAVRPIRPPFLPPLILDRSQSRPGRD